MTDQRMTPKKIEHIFLSLSAAMLLVFLMALFYSAFGMGMHLPDREGEIDPSQVRQTAPFDAPGLREIGEGRYEAVFIGMAWGYEPREITVPAGSEVTFIATSTDVIHGFHIEGTRVNFMLLPGQIGKATYTFREPREHLIICHEYCGAGHHLMYARVIVE
ncbi:MAG: cytochrome c oxidase subunit II [Gemmatimonadota bacterium]